MYGRHNPKRKPAVKKIPTKIKRPKPKPTLSLDDLYRASLSRPYEPVPVLRKF